MNAQDQTRLDGETEDLDRQYGLEPVIAVGMNRRATPLTASERVHCPYCSERIALAIDLTLAEQDYIEDCSVCCGPIEIVVRVTEGKLKGLSTRRSDGA